MALGRQCVSRPEAAFDRRPLSGIRTAIRLNRGLGIKGAPKCKGVLSELN